MSILNGINVGGVECSVRWGKYVLLSPSIVIFVLYFGLIFVLTCRSKLKKEEPSIDPTAPLVIPAPLGAEKVVYASQDPSMMGSVVEKVGVERVEG